MYNVKRFWNWITRHLFTKSEVIDKDTLRIIPKGHTIFKYNIATKALTIANCIVEDKKKTIHLQKGCMYVNGLNRDSAIKKLAKMKLKVLSGSMQPQRSQPKGTNVYFKQLN